MRYRKTLTSSSSVEAVCIIAHLMDLIDETVDPLVVTSDTFAIDPDYVEAACFGWLGLQCLDHRPLDTQHITGAKTPVSSARSHTQLQAKARTAPTST